MTNYSYDFTAKNLAEFDVSEFELMHFHSAQEHFDIQSRCAIMYDSLYSLGRWSEPVAAEIIASRDCAIQRAQAVYATYHHATEPVNGDINRNVYVPRIDEKISKELYLRSIRGGHDLQELVDTMSNRHIMAAVL